MLCGTRVTLVLLRHELFLSAVFLRLINLMERFITLHQPTTLATLLYTVCVMQRDSFGTRAKSKNLTVYNIALRSKNSRRAENL